MHDLRHVAASLMLAAGVDVKIVSETLGHSDSRITRDIYQSVMPKAARDAAEATAAMVPRGAVRRPLQVVAEVEPTNAEVAPAPAEQNGHAMGTQERSKIAELRRRLVRQRKTPGHGE
ncbi:tyrosine-type recombinase/integrase [Streptomyces jumonjinensis]|uniref:tyrosine-type recombinase/integrase n=1 Tax=Streptomyces jumonjinensis TaxID=1945 RepID=UPI0012975326